MALVDFSLAHWGQKPRHSRYYFQEYSVFFMFFYCKTSKMYRIYATFCKCIEMPLPSIRIVDFGGILVTRLANNGWSMADGSRHGEFVQQFVFWLGFGIHPCSMRKLFQRWTPILEADNGYWESAIRLNDFVLTQIQVIFLFGYDVYHLVGRVKLMAVKLYRVRPKHSVCFTTFIKNKTKIFNSCFYTKNVS